MAAYVVITYRPAEMPEETWKAVIDAVMDAVSCATHAAGNRTPRVVGSSSAVAMDVSVTGPLDEEWLRDRLAVLKAQYRLERVRQGEYPMSKFEYWTEPDPEHPDAIVVHREDEDGLTESFSVDADSEEDAIETVKAADKIKEW